MNWQTVLRKAMKNPGMAVNTSRGLLRGYYYRVKFRLLGRRVQIGRFFKVTGPLDIRGPGMVVFGDYCTVVSSRLRPTTPYTHSPDAVIRFGDRVMLTRTRLGCVKRIEVGNDAGLAEAWIMDSDFHSVEARDGPRHRYQRRFKGRGDRPECLDRRRFDGSQGCADRGELNCRRGCSCRLQRAG